MALDLYVITDEKIGRGRSHAELARLACAGGADAIQLRDKHKTPEELIRIGQEIRAITREAGALFLVNDSLEVALACGADGVHLGQDDMAAGRARSRVPRPFIIGISAGTVAEAVAAEEAGADYVALSPVFATSSKENAGPGQGLAVLRAMKAAVSIPVIAIGGITRENLGDVVEAGAEGVAVISAVVAQPDITAAARDLKERIAAAKRGCR